MDRELRGRLESFVKPLYQDLDGASRFDEVERIARIARSFHKPASDTEERAFELLLIFHGLGRWLEKVGNLSRLMLVVGGLDEQELRATAASLRRLDAPVTESERAVAAAMAIDGAGVRGLAERFSRARREGHSVQDVVRDALAGMIVPQWLPEEARALLVNRFEARRQACEAILRES